MTGADAPHRSTRTFLFTDIEGSTRQWEESPAMRGRVEHHFAVLRTAVADGGGEVFATMGDGVAAAFASAEAAVRAAVAAQRLMPSIGLSVRMGLHTGEVERVDDDFRGRPVNRAARIMAAAHGGQVLLSDLTAALVRTAPAPVTVKDVGVHQLRDLTGAERLWQVVHPDLIDGFPPPRGIDAHGHNLPSPRSSLIGRDADVCRVGAALGAHRVVTLTGVGGVGKTRLAVEAATELSSRMARVWFVELANVAGGDDVTDAIARAVGVGAVPQPWSAARAVLTGDPTLLVVDNCEHVVDSAAAAIDALTSSCPQLTVLATSREALGIDGEQLVAVRPLDPLTTAVELFYERAASAGAELADADLGAVAHICRRLDGIPLAIELAAARVATLGVPAIVGALDDRFSLLSGGRRRAVDRHSTMRATIDWSYRLLDDAERRLVRWLAVFTNGFELDAVEHVAATMGLDPVAVLDHVTSLVHKSMLVAEPHETGTRYRMLETMRAFAAEELDGRDERAAAVDAMAQWVASITDLSYRTPCTALVERRCRRLERDVDNWREAVIAAAHRRDADLAGRLCGPPAAFFLLGRNDLAEFVRPLLALCDDGGARRQAVLCALAVSAGGSAGRGQLAAWAAEMEALEVRHPSGVGAIVRWLSSLWAGDFAGAVEVCVRAASDERLALDTREQFVGMAAVDHFSLTGATDDPDDLFVRCAVIAGRSEVALQRAMARLAMAWAAAGSDPDRAVDLVRAARPDIAAAPALTRLSLSGSVSRLVARLDPQLASRGLLEQLDALPRQRSFVDLVPLSYAVELLGRVGHPAASTALVGLAAPAVMPYLSMMDFLGAAWRAAAEGLVSLDEVHKVVRAALTDVAEGRLTVGAPT